MNRWGPGLAGGLLLLGVLGSQNVSPPTSTANPSPIRAAGNVKQSDQADYEGGQVAPLCRHFLDYEEFRERQGDLRPHRELKEITERPPKNPTELRYAAREHVPPNITRCLPDQAKLQVLVALVPDPVHTNLSLEFNRRLDALQTAAWAAGYLIDGYWLPWIASNAASSNQEGSPLRMTREERENYPGILLFRSGPTGVTGPTGKVDKEPRILIMFVVGESPTAGINKEQFYTAIGFLREINSAKSAKGLPHDLANRESQGLRVDLEGPNFSGSLQSLELAIESIEHSTGSAQPSKPTDAPASYRIVSGSATSKAALGAFQDWISARGTKRPAISFVNLTRTDQETTEFLTTSLHSLGYEDEEIAFLKESDTAYGAGSQTTGTGPQTKFHTYLFPRNVARLRSAYQSETQLAVANDGQRGAPRQDLPLVWRQGDEEERRDAIPSFAPEQEPVSQDSLLIFLAERLRRTNVRVAVILATDVLDRLFLARYLHKACPDIRLVLYDSDRLFLRPSEMPVYGGMLQFSYFPLIFPGAFRIPGQENPIAFASPSSASHGTVTATLSLLVRKLDFTSQDGGYSCPNPFLWFTVTGRNGSWPIAIDRCSPGQEPPPAATFIPIKPPEKLPYLFESLVALLALVALVLVAIVILVNRPVKRPQLPVNARVRSAVWPFVQQLRDSWLGPYCFTEGVSRRAFYLAVGNLILGTSLGTLTACLWFYPNPPDWKHRILLWFAGAGGVVCLSLATALIRELPLSGKKALADWTPGYPHYAIPAFAFAGVLQVKWWSWSSGANGAFFVYRAVHLESGVSPLMPFLLAMGCACLWTWTSARRHVLHETRVPIFPTAPEAFPKGRRKEWNRLFSGRPFRHRWQWGVFLGSFAFIVAISRPWESLRGLEGQWFTGLYTLLILGCFGLLAMTWVRFLGAWTQLRSMLNHLENSPIRSAFDRLPKTYASNIIWQPRAFEKSYVLQSRSVESLRALCQLIPGDLKLQAFAARIRRLLQDLRSRFRHVRDRSSREMQRVLAQCADHIVTSILIDRWLAGSSDSWEKGEAKGGVRSVTVDLGGHARDARNESLQEAGASTPPGEDVTLKKLVLAEEIVALRFVAAIRFATMQMRNLLFFITFGFVLLVLSLESYSFTSHRSLSLALTFVFFVLGAIVIYVFAGLERDPVISRISDTDAGKLSWDFYVRVASYGALPLLTILASQFPSLGQFLLAWLHPSLEALK